MSRQTVEEYYASTNILTKWDKGEDVGDKITPAAYLESYRTALLELIEKHCLHGRQPQLIRILSIGAGTGKFEKVLQNRGYNIVAIDIFDEAIEIIRRKGIEAIKASGKDLPFEDSSFDIILIDGALGHMASQFEIPASETRIFSIPLGEAYRVLRGTGAVVVSDDVSSFGKDYELNPRVDLMRVSDAVMKKELSAVGFREVIFEVLPYERPQFGYQDRRVTFAYKTEGNTSNLIDSNTDLSSLSTPASKTGGIDFRNLPIVTQAISNLSAGISLTRLNSLNLNSEWQEIEKLVNSGITPSSERIKEYVQASCYNGYVEQDKRKVILCISDILRLEEEDCSSAEQSLKDILIILESGRSNQELKAVFTGR